MIQRLMIPLAGVALGLYAQQSLPGPAMLLGGGPQVEAVRQMTVEYVAAEGSVPGNVVKGAPYSAQAVTETTQVLADGNRIRHNNTAQVYRDSDGR